jgi:predicted dehydrogenase
VRVGIAGFGLGGAVFHAPLVDSVDGLEVAAVMTRDPGRVAAARAAHPSARVVGELDELLDGIDLLVVTTPNRSHAPIALAGLRRGLAVVVDKPIAPDAAQARALLEAAPPSPRLTVFQNRRWDDDFLTLRRVLEEGSLGELVRFESRYERFRPEVDAGRWRERPEPEEGGGQLLDLGAHVIDQALVLFGPPRSVFAVLTSRRPGSRTDDEDFLLIEHEGGMRSHLWISAVNALAGPRFRVSGLRAGFATDGVDPQEDQLQAGLRPGDAGYGEGRSGLLAGREVALERGRYEDFYAAARDWARGEAPAPVDPADGVRVLDVVEAARRSSAAREVVRVKETT